MASVKTRKTQADKPEASLEERILSGEISAQRISSLVRELNSQSAERLNAVALTDGIREYTYRQMFRQWDKYAETFSALDICGENGSRVGVVTFPYVETIFALYGLNMTGASVSLLMETATIDWKELKKTIRSEGITDLVLIDAAIVPDVYLELRKNKNRLGLRHIIMLRVDTRSLTFMPRFQKVSAMSKAFIRCQPDVVYMDALIRKYEATEIKGSADTSEDAAIILHTSGTTGGIRKPIPFSNRAFNEGAARFLRMPEFREMFDGTAVSLSGLPLCTCYGAIDQFHLLFLFGGKIVTAPLVLFSPRFFEVVDECQANISFLTCMEAEYLDGESSVDLSSLKLVAVGGSYLPPDTKKRIDDNLRRFGFGKGSSLGYGLSEAGGACLLAEAGSTDDTIGRPLPGVRIKVFCEEEDKYYDIEDGEHEGILMISTTSMSSGRLDDKVFFEHEVIDGEKYIKTYDIVHINADGSISYVRRTNRFFLNNGGERYDTELVERVISSQPGIAECGVVGAYCKHMQDTVPVLYVRSERHGKEAERAVKDALYTVFVKKAELRESELPYQCVIVDKMPHTVTGKVDTHQILKNPLAGIRLDLWTVKKDGKLVDIRYKPGGSVEFVQVSRGNNRMMVFDPKRLFADEGSEEELGKLVGLPLPDLGSACGRWPAPPFAPDRFSGEERPAWPFPPPYFRDKEPRRFRDDDDENDPDEREERDDRRGDGWWPPFPPPPPFWRGGDDRKLPFERRRNNARPAPRFPLGRPYQHREYGFDSEDDDPCDDGPAPRRCGEEFPVDFLMHMIRYFFRPSEYDRFYED